MSERDAPTARLMAGAVRAEPWRYSANVVLWATIWLMPVIPALIVRAFFDSLELETGANAITFVAAVLAYGLGRIAIMVLGMHNDIHFEFRNASQLRRNMLERIYEMPAAQAVQGSPGRLGSGTMGTHRVSFQAPPPSLAQGMHLYPSGQSWA